MVVLTSLALMLTTQAAEASGATLPPVSIPTVAQVAAWFSSPHWGDVPKEHSGSAAGLSHTASAASTRAKRGAGHAPGKGRGELPLATPYARPFKVGASATRTGFNSTSSRRIAAKSTATSTYYQNADGTVTSQIAQTPVNYQDGSAGWQPINTTVAKAPDGRWQEKANSLSVNFAPKAAVSGLATFAVDANHSISYGLKGAASATADASGSTVTYSSVLPDTNLTVTPTGIGLKEDIVLTSAKAGNSWTFPLTLKGLTPKLDSATGSVDLLDSTGTVREQIPAAYAYDSKVDPRSGDPATTHAVSYQLVSSGGSTDLVVTLDPSWLHAPAREFPVTVDPTITDGWTTTYAESDNAGDHSTEQSIKVGSYDSGTHSANAFINHAYTAFDGSKVTVTAASLTLFDTWASICTPERFDVAPVTSSWTPTGVTAYPGPSYGASIGNLTPTVPAACANTAANRSVGNWVTVPLTTTTFQGWANGTTADDGLAVYAATTDADHWKQFGSFNDPGYTPYLSLTYTGNVAPQITQQYPLNNASEQTTTPELTAAATDDSTTALKYDFLVYNTAGTKVADSGLVTSGSWTVPAGDLTWGQTYYWTVQADDGSLYSAAPAWEAMSIDVPQPVITSSLSQNSSDQGFDPSIGNYTTSDTDADISTVGPALEVDRDYNSRDPRWTGAFGAGWSSIFDAKATEQYNAAGAVTSVVVTYPDGSEVGFGKNPNGSFTPPSGRFATFASVTGGGYTLTDKNDTVYTFTQSLGSGAYGITSVADADARAVTFSWTGGEITQMQSAVSGRALHITWATPSGAAAPHIASVYTDPVTGTDQNTDLSWQYGYTGDQLTSVCDPADYAHCTTYAYTSGSQYSNAALDLDPHSLWTLGESSGTTAASSVTANEGTDNATYANVTLGQPGPLAGSNATSAGFNGTSSSLLLPNSLANATDSESVSMWFKTSTAGGVLFSYNSQPMDSASLTGDYTPSIYVGSDGKLNAEFWYSGAVAPIVSSATVDDGKWHHVVLSAAGNTQTLYLDGKAAGTVSGQVSFSSGVSTENQAFTYVGAGYIGGEWPDEPNEGKSGQTGYPSYFNGSIADVALYSKPLMQADVNALYSSGTHPASLMSSVTRPSGKAYAGITYAPGTDTVTQVTDENGGQWKIAAPVVAGSSQTYRGAVLGGGPSTYLRLGDPAGSTGAADEVRGGTGTYTNVTLGTGGPFADESAGSFNGTSSSVLVPQNLTTASSASEELWFKTSTGGGVLLGDQNATLANSASATTAVPQLWVGTDGKLYGGMWTSAGSVQLASGKVVTDGQWHHVVLSAGGSSQTLYLDGSQDATESAAKPLSLVNPSYVYAGASKVGTGWDELTASAIDYFKGSIAEVAVYNTALAAQDAASHFAAGKDSTGLLPVSTVKVTDPAGAVTTYRYNVDSGNQLMSVTDGLGNTTSYGYDTGGFEHTVTDPNGDVTTTGHDVRGNTVSLTTCQNQAADVCSSNYYTYYPDDTTAQLTPDARNDLLLTSRDGRSSSATDPTYETSYGYDTAGDQTSVTSPPVAGFPSGRTTTTVYSDGTATYPAADSGNVPKGLPVKTVSPAGAVNTVAYFHNGDVASTTDSSGLVTTYTYDGVGQVLTKTEVSDSYPNGLTTSYVYDKDGQVVTETDPGVTDRVTGAVHTEVTTTVYDPDGDITSQTQSDATGGDAPRTETMTYNQYDQVATDTDANGNAGASNGATTTNSYDTSGNLIKVVDAQGTTTQYTYDDNGQLLTTGIWSTGDPTNPGSATFVTESSRAYDPAGRLASITDAMGNKTSYTYTDDGLQATVTKTDSNGANPYVLQSNTYDAAGNLTQQVTNNGATTTAMTVDAASRTTSTTQDPTSLDRVSRVSYTPDDLVASETDTDASGYDRTTTNTYNSAGDQTSQTLYGDASGHPSAWYPLNQTSGSTVTDASGSGNTAAATGVTWNTASDGTTSAQFAGTGSQQIATNGPVLNTTGSFTVSAWVNLSSLPTHNATVVAQSGNVNSAFMLQYNYAHIGKPLWSVDDTSADAASPSFPAAYSTAAPTVNTWTHLVDVYNVTTGTIQLYVNGALAGSGTNTAPWSANGPLTIGSDKYASAQDDQFPGSVANVQAYPEALTAAQVSSLYAKGRTGGTVGSSSTQTTSWTYDKRGLATSMTDPDGNTTDYTYDEAGHLAVTTDPAVSVESTGGVPVVEHPVATTGYDTFGEPAEQLDADNNETTMAYDADGNEVSQTDPQYTPPGASSPITATTVWTYDSAGNKIAESQPDGETTHYTYDQMGNLVQTQDPDGNKTHSSYDLDGNALSVVDGNGATTEATYDYLGRPLTSTTLERYPTTQTLTTTDAYTASTTDPGGAWMSSSTTPGGVTTGYGYDHLGELTSTTDGAGNTTKYGYDFKGDQQTTTLPDSTHTETDYNASSQPTFVKQYDASGTLLNQTSDTYDGDGNLVGSTDANGHTTTFTYDATGMMTQEVQPVSASNSITTGFGYDATGKQTRYTDGNGNNWLSSYNSWGLLNTTTEPTTSQYTGASDSTTTYYYNGDGQLVSTLQPGGVSTAMNYDADGNLLQQSGSGADAATATRNFTYDADGQMLTAATTAAGTSGANGYQAATSENFSYDDRGDLLTATGSAGTSSFSYTADGLMASRTDAAGTTNYGYDNDDRLSTLQDPETGTSLSYGYNSLSQLSSIQYGSTGQTRSYTYNSAHQLTGDTLKQGSSTLASIGYGYDNNGNLTSKTTTGVTGASANTYSYDWANRLSSWNNGTKTTSYSYDQNGNRTQVGANVYTYDARDELTSDGVNTYSYTADGTMSLDVTSSGSAAYTSDAYGQQITAGTQSYGMDALGRTISDTTNAGQGGAATRNLSFSGQDNTIASDQTDNYSYDPSGGLIGINAPGAATGSGVLALTDQHQDVIGDFTPGATALAGSTTYDPLGNVTATSNQTGNLGYQSGWTDAATGKVDMDSRWYNPGSGSFMNKDTLNVSPTPDSAAANPFAYVSDNPMGDIDPTGHCGFFGMGCGIVKHIEHAVKSVAKTIAKAVLPPAVYHAVAKEAHKIVKVARREISHAEHYVYDAYVRYVPPVIRRSISYVAKRVKKVIRHVVKVVRKVVTHVEKAVKKVVKAAAKAVKTATTYVKNHAAAITSFVVSTAVFMGCEAVTAGVGTIGCSAAAGAAGSLVNQGFKCADDGGSACSVGSFADSAVEGAVTGALGGALGELGGSLIGKLAPKALDAVGGLFTTSTEEAGESAASDATDDLASKVEGGGDGGGEGEGSGDGTSCPTTQPHSFVGATPVLMADGSTKSIDQIKVGDKIADSVPGQKGTRSNTVTAVIVTHTDHDFVDVTLTPLGKAAVDSAVKQQPKAATTSLKSKVVRKAGLGLAASAAGFAALLGLGGHHGTTPPFAPAGYTTAAAPAAAAETTTPQAEAAAAGGGTLETTFHHPFYDETQNSFVQAEYLHTGDILQTPTGTAEVTALHLFHANTTTYDLTIGTLHTYYVEAGSTPVLVHNCDDPVPGITDPRAVVDHVGPKLQAHRLQVLADAEAKGIEPPTTVSVAYDSESGEVGFGARGDSRNMGGRAGLDPEITESMPQKSLEPQWDDPSECAEIGACADVIDKGADSLENTSLLTVHTTTGKPIPFCANCEETFSGATDLSAHTFPGERF